MAEADINDARPPGSVRSAYMKRPQTLRSALAVVTGVALVTRLLALLWNDRLFGDVNLYALVARQWTQTGRLDYPGKFDFFTSAPYLALSSPVSQHPPAWSWLAGLVASTPLGLDEFIALKLLCLLSGLLMVILGMMMAHYLDGLPTAIATGLVLALHPMLVDYSANGSPYIAVATGGLAVALAVIATGWNPWLRGLLAGIGAGAAWSFHGAGILLVPAGLAGLALNALPGTRIRLLTGYTAAAAITFAPTMLWNQIHFGKLLHSTSTFYVPGKLGLVKLVQNAQGVHYEVASLEWTHVVPYLGLALKSSLRFVLHLGLETGFLGLVLAAFGALALRRHLPPRAAVGLFLIAASIILPCLGWPEFKYRFIVLLLPFVLILTVLGAARLSLKLRFATSLSAALGCIAFWIVQMSLTGSPAKYYAYDREHRGDYRLMLEAAAFLREQPPGVVISFPRQLDGGTESVWWHRQPAVIARGFPTELLQRLAADFRPAYLLLSPDRREAVPANATLEFSNTGYLVYSLPQYTESGKALHASP